MEGTALNLIAIGVFLMTLSVFLTPLLHISPFIPAAATLGILGLATVDSFTFNSRGVTILLDSLSSTQHRKRVIHHEAGHFLAAYLLGIPITGYTLSAWEAFRQGQPGLGGVQFEATVLNEKLKDVREFPLLLERFCTVWMAGIAAETLIYGNSQGGESDRLNLRQALKLAGLPETTYQSKERWSLLQAKTLLDKHQKSYFSLIQAMEKRTSVEECYQIIRIQEVLD